jgi:hypothetical protein
MSASSPTAGQTLEYLLQALSKRDESLAQVVRNAIDAGKDIEEVEGLGTNRRKRRVYRKVVRFTDEEALRVALDALRACLVELPFFINSAVEDFKAAAIGASVDYHHTVTERSLRAIEKPAGSHQGILEVELQTATQVSPAARQTQRLEAVSLSTVEEQRNRVQEIAHLAGLGD